MELERLRRLPEVVTEHARRVAGGRATTSGPTSRTTTRVARLRSGGTPSRSDDWTAPGSQERATAPLRFGATTRIRRVDTLPVPQVTRVVSRVQRSTVPWAPATTGPGGLPDELVAGIEAGTGIALDDVRVHRNSSMPATVGAHAVASDRDIHLGPGQERHLAHEAWHLVQQRQGRVRPTTRVGDAKVNDDPHLEREADHEGAKLQPATSAARARRMPVAVRAGSHVPSSGVLQRKQFFEGFGPGKKVTWDTEWDAHRKAERVGELGEAGCALLMKKIGTDPQFADDLALLRRGSLKPLKPPDTGGSAPQRKTPSGKTQVIHMNYSLTQTGKREARDFEHLVFFAATARQLGLRLEILTTQQGFDDIKGVLTGSDLVGLEYEIHMTDRRVSEWAEDSVEFLQSGSLAVLEKFRDQALEEGMQAGRRERWKMPPGYEKEIAAEHKEWVPLGMLVNAGQTGTAREREARETQAISHLRVYLEGGNMISGEDRDDVPVILVGKDAIASTAHAYGLSSAEVRELIRQDFGLERVDQVLCVEQPGKFHLDMGLLFVGKGVVIVNDSREDRQRAEETASKMDYAGPKRIAAQLQLRCSLEDQAARDLEEGNMKVLRAKLEGGANFNFFNGEFVLGKDGQYYYLTNGGPKEQEQKFKAMLVDDLHVVADVFFSPSAAAQSSLGQQGGVGCRIKGAPTVKLPPLVKTSSDTSNDK